eukprot:scaffold14782_cov124-Skeletonema_marinoi.AAC.2
MKISLPFGQGRERRVKTIQIWLQVLHQAHKLSNCRLQRWDGVDFYAPMYAASYIEEDDTSIALNEKR